MKLSEKFLCAAFLIIAIVSMIFAISCFLTATPSGSTVVHEYYGGDAYTGIQHASATTATNIYHAGKTIAQLIINIGGFFFILVALTFASLSVSKFIKAKESSQNENTVDQSKTIHVAANTTESV